MNTPPPYRACGKIKLGSWGGYSGGFRIRGKSKIEINSGNKPQKMKGTVTPEETQEFPKENLEFYQEILAFPILIRKS